MANNTIGYLPYSLSLRPVNPGDAESEKKVAATLQSVETIDLDKLAKHMAEHNTPFTQGTIAGVLKDMVGCAVELLRQGYAVELDGLAKFFLSCKSNMVDYVEDFNPANDIKKVVIRTSVDGEALASVNTNIDFIYVMTREEQAAAKKAAKAALPQAPEDPDSGDDNTGGGGSGSGGDPGVTE